MAAMMRHLCTPCARACHGPHGCCRPVYPSPPEAGHPGRLSPSGEPDSIFRAGWNHVALFQSLWSPLWRCVSGRRPLPPRDGMEWNGMKWTEWSDIVGSPSGYPLRRDALTPWARLQWPPLDLSRPKVLVHTGTVPLRIGTPHRCRGSLYVEGSSYVRGIPIRVRTVLIRARTPYADEDSLYV